MNKLLSTGKVLLGTSLTAAILLSGCGSSNNDFVITNTNLQTAPTAVNDAFSALGNATVNQAATGVLANDTTNGAAISSFDPVGSQGGSIVLNADGSFSYTPLFGFVGAETFGYTLSNNGGTSDATVTMTSTAFGRFVDNTAAPGGNGSQASPFDTLAQGTAVAQAGDTIFVARGNGTNTGLAGAINLPAGVDLIGEGTGLILAQVIVPQGLAPSLTGPITCGGSNTVSGLNIDGSASNGVIINGVADVTVSNNTIGNPTSEHINCDNVTGTLTIDGNTLETPPNLNQDFIGIVQINQNGNAIVTNNIFTNGNNQAVDACISAGGINSDMTVEVSGNVANGTVADEFLTGITVTAGGTSQITATISKNTLNNLSSNGISVGADTITASMSADIFDNTVSNASNGIQSISNGTVKIQGNVISNSDFGILLATFLDGGTVIATNNNISDSVNAAVNIMATRVVSVALRNNTMLGGGLFSLATTADDSANLCLEVTGNTVNADMIVDTFDANANVDLENGAAGLETVNTFNLGMPDINPTATGTVTNRAAGFCQIP